MSSRQALIAGGGIGGLAAALAASRAGWYVRLYERAAAFSEVGAGVQLGPNVVRRLHGWGLQDALARVAAFPERLQVKDALSGRVLGTLPLGQRVLKKYGAPYATVHRADLHALLLQAVRGQGNVWLNLNSAVTGYDDNGREIVLETEAPAVCPPGRSATAEPLQPSVLPNVEGDVLIGADGLWSR
ncbi:MAG: monooxygenase, FAD-binding protein, partial [Polaromonas sp.]|nr:monooxygenase, FAD-binding protein [Polaromonas sp.]